MAVNSKAAFNDVFISYSRKDNDFVRRFVRELEKDQREIWVDWEDIEYGEDWWDRIKDGIESADNFLFILTPDSVHSRVCYDEVEHAVENGKRIIPVLHRPINNEDDFQQMHPAISQHNWLPFLDEDDFDESFQKLMETINADPLHVKAHTQLLAKAREWEQNKRQGDRLLAGQALDEAILWQSQAVNKSPELTELQAEFIANSQVRRRRTNQRRYIAVIGVMIGALVLAAIAIVQANDATVALSTAEAASTAASVARSTAEFNATRAFVAQETAIANEEIAQSNAEQANSLVLAASAREEIERGNWQLELPLLLEANRAEEAPELVLRRLADAGYQPGVTANLTRNSSSRSLPEAFGVTQHNVQLYVLVIYVTENQLETAKVQIIDVRTGTAVSAEVTFDATINPIAPVYVVGSEQTALLVAPGEVVLLNNSTGTIEGTVLLPLDEEQTVRALALSRDNTRLTAFVANRLGNDSGSGFAAGSLYDIALADLEVEEVTELGDVSVGQAVLRSDGEMLLLVATDQNKYSLWTREDGLIREPIRLNPRERILNIALSPNGERLAVEISVDAELGLTELRVLDFGLRRVFRVVGHSGTLIRLSFTSDSQELLAAYSDGVVVFQPLGTGTLTSRREVAFDMTMQDLQFGPFGNQGYVLHQQDIYRLSFNSDVPLDAVRVGNNVTFPSIDLDQARIIYALTSDETSTIQSQPLQQNDVTTREVTTVTVVDDVIEHVAVAADGSELMYATRQELFIVDLTTNVGRQIWQKPTPFALDEIVSITYSPTGEHVLFMLANGDLHAAPRNLLTNDVVPLGSLLTVHHANTTIPPIFAPDGRFVAFLTADASSDFITDVISVWSLQTNTFSELILDEAVIPQRLLFSPDGTQLLVTTAPGQTNTAAVLLLDARNGRIIQRLADHQETATALAFSADGSAVLTGSADVIVWWALGNGEVLRRFSGDGTDVVQVRIAPDRSLFWVTEQGLLNSWQSETREQVVDFICDSRYIEPLGKEDRRNFGITRITNLCDERADDTAS